MRKLRTVAFAALVLMCIAAHVASAQRRPPVQWVSGGGTLVVVQGEELEFEASFFSTVPIPAAHWWASLALEPLFGWTGSQTPIGQVEANRIYTIRHHIRVPENFPARLYSGIVQVYHHKETGDPSQRVYPEVLPVKIYVMEPTP